MELGEDSFFPAHELAMPGDRASEFEYVALPHAASLLRYALHLAGEKGRADEARCPSCSPPVREDRPDSGSLQRTNSLRVNHIFAERGSSWIVVLSGSVHFGSQ